MGSKEGRSVRFEQLRSLAQDFQPPWAESGERSLRPAFREGDISRELAARRALAQPSLLARFETEIRADERARVERTREYFGILRGPEDLAALIELRGRGPLSKEARTKLHEFVDDRGKKAVARLKRWLGLKQGRPPQMTLRERWAVAATLRQKDPKEWSYARLAMKLDPDYSANPSAAKDRMLKGLKAYRNAQKPTK